MNHDFFIKLQELVDHSEITIDRPKGSTHPRYPEYIYPYDYGYISDTTSSDDAEIDCWVGSTGATEITGIVVVYDPVKKDVEIKLLIGCNDAQMQEILACHRRGQMTATLLQTSHNAK